MNACIAYVLSSSLKIVPFAIYLFSWYSCKITQNIHVAFESKDVESTLFKYSDRWRYIVYGYEAIFPQYFDQLGFSWSQYGAICLVSCLPNIAVITILWFCPTRIGSAKLFMVFVFVIGCIAIQAR